MGCFDTFHHPCPRCGADVSIQCHAGACVLADYTISDVPPNVAGALHGRIVPCPKCGLRLEIKTQVQVSVVRRGPQRIAGT